MTAQRLRKAQLAFERARADEESARAERARAMREALEDGWTQEQISAAMGLTQGRVSQILKAA